MPFSSQHNMGAGVSSSSSRQQQHYSDDKYNNKDRFKTFPGSAFLEKTFCGSIDTTDPAEYEGTNLATRLLKKADVMCVSSPTRTNYYYDDYNDDDDEEEDEQTVADDDVNNHGIEGRNTNIPKSKTTKQKKTKNLAVSALFARALVSEVTDNPKTMRPAQMADREFKLLKAQQAALRASETSQHAHRAVGAPGGVGPPRVLHSIAYACSGGNGDDATVGTTSGGNPILMQCAATPGKSSNVHNNNAENSSMTWQTSSFKSHVRGLREGSSSTTHMIMSNANASSRSIDNHNNHAAPRGQHSITIGLCMSRQSAIGHAETVTRQSAFDFNELQDRAYKYVSSTDTNGWQAGGGESGGLVTMTPTSDENVDWSPQPASAIVAGKQAPAAPPVIKKPAVDQVHIPIINIDCPNEQAVDRVIQALASGDIFIPHMAVLPEALSVQGVSPPNLIVRFDCDRSDDDAVPDDWPNWCLEFMHNQLYEYFLNLGAQWMQRPFSITLARQVRWKTVKHMNRYFARAEKILEEWKQAGPKYLDPELSFLHGGATPDEVANPHGVYLFRNGAPTNYFAPNFDPPYTTRMTRSLLLNVLNKSWNKKICDWTSEPTPRLLTPSMLLAVACGCSDPSASGYMAREVTNSISYSAATSTASSSNSLQQQHPQKQQSQQQPPQVRPPQVQQQVHRQAPPLLEEIVPIAPTAAQITDRTPEEYHQETATAAMKSIREETDEDELFDGLDEEGDDEEKTTNRKQERNAAVATVSSPTRSTSSYGSSLKNETKFSVESGVESGVTTVIQRNTASSSRYSHSEASHGSRDSASRSSDPPGESLQSVTPRYNYNDAESVVWKMERHSEHLKITQSISSHVSLPSAPGMTASPSAIATAVRTSRYTPDPLSPVNRRHMSPMGQPLGSAQSLDYSTDGSSAFLTTTMDETSTLLGQNFASVGSGSVFSNVSALRQQPLQQPLDEQSALQQQDCSSNSSRVASEESFGSDLSLSHSEGGSSFESVIPTDEELFEIGWAKALDAKSGSYYYFTLDRTHTVWENPLDPMSVLQETADC